MNKQSITFSANEQTLEKTGGIDNYASNIVSYVEATFTIGENWTGYDVVRAVWESAYAKISTVLDSDHKCVVPAEVLRHKSKVNVNLVGSIVTNDVLTDRLTTYPVHAITVDADARIDSTETQPITPSQFEQFVEAVHADAESIQDYSYDSEAWAKGTRGGVAVPSTDPTYHNNSKYYADQGAELEQEVTDLKSDLSDETSARILLAGRVTTAESNIDTLETHKVAQPLDENNQPTDGTDGQLLRTKGDGSTEWVDEGLPTDEQTAQAVSDWLNDHPEATTTVQDGSLTEAKFSDALKLKTIKDYVTPQMFGAKADGVTDDATAFELALNSGSPVCVPSGTYYIGSPLNNPTNIILFGQGERTARIKLGDSLLQNNIELAVISGIYFYCNQNDAITVFPVRITNSLIDGCEFRYFTQIFYQIRICTRIINNYIAYLQGVFCESIIDSIVAFNYINAPAVKNPQTVCFKSLANTRIIGNFIDYMYKVFAVDTELAMYSVIVSGNTFDLCYCIFYKFCVGVTFTGNTIYNCTKSDNWDVSENEEMNTTPWCVIKRVSTAGAQSLKFSSFVGNAYNLAKLDMFMVSDYNKYPTNDILIDEPIPAEKIDFKAYKSNNFRDLENIVIRPMLKRKVDSLPSAALTGNVVSFNNDEVIYNGNLYVNIAGTWKQATS